MGIGYRPEKKILGTDGYRQEKKFWVPMGTGRKKNFGYRWVTGKFSLMPTPRKNKSARTSNFRPRVTAGDHQTGLSHQLTPKA